MTCVMSVRYSVKFNGTLLDSFLPSHGLRQGDPLSPFLFLFVTDGLSAILNQGVRSNDITPVKICRRAPGISHLLFADDTMLFFEASHSQDLHIKEALDAYELATGQSLNYDKCCIFFGSACPATVQEHVRPILHVTTSCFEEKYLGLPTPEGRMSKGKFQNLQTSLTKRLIQWGDGHLAQPGREVLIKSVVQALPTYIMGVFKLLFSVCDNLTRMVRNFYWGSDKGKRKVHWEAWEHLLQPKCKGGLGFRDFCLFNQALLARRAWRLIVKPDSLCARLLKARYYLDGKIEDTVFSGNASSSWTTICHGLVLLKKGFYGELATVRALGCGEIAGFPGPFLYKPVTMQGRCRIRFVSKLLNDNGSWNVHVLQSYFLPCDVAEILKIRASPRLEEDTLARGPGLQVSFLLRVPLEPSSPDDGSSGLSGETDGACSSSPDDSRKC